MRTLIEANLCDGVIYGDNVNLEYVYMPASEIGVKNPICVFEENSSREDISCAKTSRRLQQGLKKAKIMNF